MPTSSRWTYVALSPRIGCGAGKTAQVLVTQFEGSITSMTAVSGRAPPGLCARLMAGEITERD